MQLIGRTNGDGVVTMTLDDRIELVNLPLTDLRAAYEGTLPAMMASAT